MKKEIVTIGDKYVNSAKVLTDSIYLNFNGGYGRNTNVFFETTGTDISSIEDFLQSPTGIISSSFCKENNIDLGENEHLIEYVKLSDSIIENVQKLNFKTSLSPQKVYMDHKVAIQDLQNFVNVLEKSNWKKIINANVNSRCLMPLIGFLVDVEEEIMLKNKKEEIIKEKKNEKKCIVGSHLMKFTTDKSDLFCATTILSREINISLFEKHGWVEKTFKEYGFDALDMYLSANKNYGFPINEEILAYFQINLFSNFTIGNYLDNYSYAAPWIFLKNIEQTFAKIGYLKSKMKSSGKKLKNNWNELLEKTITKCINEKTITEDIIVENF